MDQQGEQGKPWTLTEIDSRGGDMLSARRRLAKLAKKAKAQKERAKLAAAEAERETQRERERDAEAWSEIALGEIVVGNDIIRVHPRLLEWVAEYKRAEAAGDTEQLEALDARFTDLVEEITATKHLFG